MHASEPGARSMPLRFVTRVNGRVGLDEVDLLVRDADFGRGSREGGDDAQRDR